MTTLDTLFQTVIQRHPDRLDQPDHRHHPASPWYLLGDRRRWCLAPLEGWLAGGRTLTTGCPL